MINRSSYSFDPAHLQYLDAEEQVQLQAGLESLVGGESPSQFITRVWPDEPPPKHLQPILDAAEEARIRPVRCTIDIGPGHAKTTILLRILIWWLTRSPADQNAYITYSAGQAHDKSSKALDYADDAGLTLAVDSKAKGHWHTPQGGGLIAAGAQGKLTGQRLPGLCLYDDPYKSELEARSFRVNTNIKERFKGVAFTRLQGGSIFVLHTRYGEDDLIGWINRVLKWDSIHIPTLSDEIPDLLGRKILGIVDYLALRREDRARFGPVNPQETDLAKKQFGEVAWPEKYPYEICTEPCGHDGHLAEIRETIGEYLWHGMYQGRPRPLGKAVFHEPARYRLNKVTIDGVVHESEFSWKGKRGVIMADTAASAKTSADWTVLLVLAMSGLGAESEMWIVDCIRVQEEIPEIVVIMKRLQRQYRLMVGIETVAAGTGRAVSQSLRRIDKNLRIIDVETLGKDKFTRAIPISAAWNNGRVYTPIDVDWADTLIDEFKKFTGVSDLHDDQVDAGAHGWNLLYRAQRRITSADYAQDSGI